MAQIPLRPSLPPRVEPYDPALRYRMWRLERLPRRDDLYRQRLASHAMRYRPTVSIVTPVWDTPPDLLDRMLRSVVNQTYPYWEHCLADDGSADRWLASYLERRAAADPRLRFIRHPHNRGIVAASNDALALATGDFIGMLDHDDELSPDALYACISRLNQRPDTDVIYSDFDVIDRQGRHSPAWFLPDSSPELLLSLPYITHFTLYRRSVVEQVGRWRAGYDGSQDFDLALRVSHVSDRIEHVPQVLYHWRQWERSVAANPTAKPYAFAAARRAVADHLLRLGTEGVRHDTQWLGLDTVRFTIVGAPMVSVVGAVPAGLTPRHCAGFVAQFTALMQGGGYDRTETILVAPPGLTRALEAAVAAARMPARVVECQQFDDPAAVANTGASVAIGDHLLFVNAALSARAAGWLSAMLEYGQQAAIGAVGAKIHRANGTLWDGGVLLPRAVPHRMQRDYALLNFSAVTGTCVMTSRAAFEKVGGFKPAATVGYPDIDYCLRLRALGYRHVVTPHANLVLSNEPVSDPRAESQALFAALWGETMQRDPYYNPNFRQDDATFTLPLGT